MSKKFLFWAFFLALTFIYLALRYLSPLFVEYYFVQGDFATLNQWTLQSSDQTLGFYQGEVQVRLWGPLSVLFSGSAFLLLCWGHLLRVSTRKFIAAVFVYLIIAKWEVLFFPPYGDAASGPFMEAIWLLQHSFDYYGLSLQPAFVYGGPKVYLFSIYPTYLAILYKLIPQTKIFLLVNHLLVFCFGALIVGYFRKILLKFCPGKLALGVSLLFFSLPLFQAQVEILNMEVPLLMFIMFSVYHLGQKNIFGAAVMAILAVMVKGVAIYMCGVVFLASAILFFSDKDHKFRIRTLLWGFLAIGFVILKCYASFYILNNRGRVAMVGLFEGWFWMKHLGVFYLYSASAMVFLVVFVRERFNKTLNVTFNSFLRRHYQEVVMFMAGGAWFALFINSYGDQIRYRLILAPFLVYVLFYVFTAVIRSQKILHRILVVMICFSFFCSYGFIYQPLDENADSKLERSLEYRNDIKLDILLGRKAQEKYHGVTIGAPFTIAQMLKFPELGYVTKGLDVMIYGYPCTYGGIKNFRGLKYLDLNKTVWVGLEVAVPEYLRFGKSYPINQYDRILEEIYVGRRRASFFVGGGSIEKMRIVTQEVLKHITQKGMLGSVDQYRPL